MCSSIFKNKSSALYVAYILSTGVWFCGLTFLTTCICSLFVRVFTSLWRINVLIMKLYRTAATGLCDYDGLQISHDITRYTGPIIDADCLYNGVHVVKYVISISLIHGGGSVRSYVVWWDTSQLRASMYLSRFDMHIPSEIQNGSVENITTAAREQNCSK